MANNSFSAPLPFSKQSDSNSVLSRLRNFLPEIRQANSLLAGQSPEQIRCDSDNAFTEGEEHIELDLILFKKARKRPQDAQLGLAFASGPPARRPLIECVTPSAANCDTDGDIGGGGGRTEGCSLSDPTTGSGMSVSASATSPPHEHELLDVHEASPFPRLVRDLLTASDATDTSDESESDASESEAEASDSGSGDGVGSGGCAEDEDDDSLVQRPIQLGVQLSGKSDESCDASGGETFSLRLPDTCSASAFSTSHTLLSRSKSNSSAASESDE